MQIMPLLNLEGETSEPSLSPDGKTLLFSWCKPDYSCGIYATPFGGGDSRLFVGKDNKDGLPGSPRWSPDGKHVAFYRLYSHYSIRLFVRDAVTPTEKDLGQICGLDSSWTPDARFLIAGVYIEDETQPFNCQPALFSVETGKQVRVLATRGGSAAVSPDGRWLAYADGKALMLQRLTADYRPAGPPGLHAREPREISAVVWTPDSKQVVYQVWLDVPHLRRVSVASGSRPQTINEIKNPLHIAELRSDGTALGTETTQVEALWRADLRESPAKMETVDDPECSSKSPGCSPDGRLQVFITTRSGASEIWLANADGTDEHPLIRPVPSFVDPRDDAAPNLVGWSPDGKWIAFTTFPGHGNADLRSYLYVIPSSGGTPRRLGRETYSLFAPTWSPDSKSLYAARGWSADNEAHHSMSSLVRVANGSVTALGVDGIWPAVSSDGRSLFFFTTPQIKLSQIPIAGGPAERLWDKEDLLWTSMAVGSPYLYLFQMPPRNQISRNHTLLRFDPGSRTAVPLVTVPFVPRFAYLSRDERFLYCGQQEDPKQRVVLVHGLF
jgi:Tol biopolymer transport system component